MEGTARHAVVPYTHETVCEVNCVRTEGVFAIVAGSVFLPLADCCYRVPSWTWARHDALYGTSTELRVKQPHDRRRSYSVEVLARVRKSTATVRSRL